jgi:DNA-binding NarL/FixJ family response regulator
MKALIVDDHSVVREGVKHILNENFKGVVVGEAASSQEALHQVRDQAWDIVILDLTLPDRSGLDVLEDMKAARPSLPILVLSMHPEEQYAIRVLKAGASGYLIKLTAPEELVLAIRKALAGGKYVSASLAEKLAFHLDRASQRPLHESLSDREFEVLVLIASGKTVSQIARELSRSVNTISSHRSRILEKLNLQTTTDLVRYAIEQKLIE